MPKTMNKQLQGIIFIISCFLVGLFVIAIIKDSEEKIIRTGKTRVLEIKGSNLIGYQNGTISWRLEADYVWAGRSKYIFRADGVRDGILYDRNGDVSVQQLQSNKVRVNTKSKTVTAYGDVQAKFLKKNDPGNFLYIGSQELRYFGTTKKTYLFRDVFLEQDGYTVRPRRNVEVDNDENVVYISDPFTMTSDEFHVTGNQMTMYIDDHLSEMLFVKLKRLGRPTDNVELDKRERDLRATDMVLTADKMVYFNDDKDVMVTIDGKIKMTHGDKKIAADIGIYNKNENYYELRGDVSIEARSLEWLLTEDQRQFDNEDIAQSIYEPVVIKTDKLTFDADDRRLEMYGNIEIKQENTHIQARRLTLDDVAGELVLKGGVKIRKGRDTMMCEEMIININEETFFAERKVLSEFFINQTR
jgi:lipopolysaccharide assembly outer membrane protein LptD (OstA)